MSANPVMPTRAEILSHGFPAGFIDHYREQAHVDRARAIGSFLALALHRLRDAMSGGTLKTGTA